MRAPKPPIAPLGLAPSATIAIPSPSTFLRTAVSDEGTCTQTSGPSAVQQFSCVLDGWGSYRSDDFFFRTTSWILCEPPTPAAAPTFDLDASSDSGSSD